MQYKLVYYQKQKEYTAVRFKAKETLTKDSAESTTLEERRLPPSLQERWGQQRE